MKHNYITAKIISIKEETPRVRTFTLNTTLKAKPGQYIMLWIPGVNEKPFGVVTNNPLRLSIANVGPFTREVHNLKIGDSMTFRGPYGSSFRAPDRHPLLIGGGYGVVPLFLLAQSFTPAIKRNSYVVIGARTKADLTFVVKFKSLGCRVVVSTDDGTAGFKGFSTDLAGNILQKNHIDCIYTCGPEVMMKKIAQMAHDSHIFCQVSIERVFKCGGIGLCGSCGFNGKLACVDGPVFSGKELL